MVGGGFFGFGFGGLREGLEREEAGGSGGNLRAKVNLAVFLLSCF